MASILLVDDHPLMREGITKVLSASPVRHSVVEAVDVNELLKKLAEQPFELLILDLSLPERSGLDVIKEIRTRYPEMPVLILSMHPEEQFGFRAFKMGAAGYLEKKSATKELTTAIDVVLNGKKYFNSKIIDQALASPGQISKNTGQFNFSDREFEVLRCIAKGMSITEISQSLHISISSVSTYRFRILEKTGLRSNADLVRFALEHKLIE